MPTRTFTQRAKQLHELRGWLLAFEHIASQGMGDTSWFQEIRAVLDEEIQEAEHNAAMKGADARNLF